MKPFLPAIIALSVAGLLLSGCEEPAPPPPKAKKPIKVKTEVKKRVKPVREARPGTPAYLDSKNGFRDVKFGSASSSIPNLAMVDEDPSRQMKTYTRSDEDLTLGKVPLKKIEYTFFDDKLCQIALYWNVESTATAQRLPNTTELSGYCTTLYGRPGHRQIKKDGTYYVWQGRKTGLMLTENLMPGVPNVVQGGWALPPTTAGEMIIYSQPLRQSAGALLAGRMSNSPSGL